MLGGIEAGGTKFVCAVGKEDGTIIDRVEIPTTMPDETIEKVIQYFRQFSLQAIGIGSFGPVDTDKTNKTYGTITATPKAGWRHYPFLQTVKNEMKIPVGFNTDVNAAALGEFLFGEAKDLDSCLYMTIGTGIGAGAIVEGRLLQGLSHPEMGHIYIRRHPDDVYQGKCPYHKDCFEGLASGPAIEARWGKKAADLAHINQVWELEGYYIAQALAQYILILAPKKIILGGGVMNQKQVFPYIYQYVPKIMNSYLNFSELSESINSYIVPPRLGRNAGIIGTLVLADQALQAETASGEVRS
ncbi:ROK family protein [Bacillus inaquosorum]|uniref:ROK family protein n=2 Tax=Bacillus inaquosorum TaxID=483913 RepID=UPI00228027B5|nr:ROK family protein [Bacillus inaquosorum]MCY7981696.1 ROK family protein [Bacillus inaquosorum]MCY8754414.1 ROK family protein [Bacillus inaquosorum]MCY9345087.1 ROK family protein [Bacillus inaquosorum]MEC0681327.1 ROK family protein [Bacillus inaquosorum]MEC3625309.1 ROK family protein [Bacillus inaquosorum]